MRMEFINILPDLSKITYVYPMLGIPIVAALTPDDVEIEMSDLEKGENFMIKDVDILAMSVLTHHAPYAYDIAKKYREKGKKVILGGLHPSALPNEALLYCNSVVVGEAELIWNSVIEDLRKNNLQKVYRSNSYVSMDLIPKSRVDLMNGKIYFNREALHASRGCPYRCSFCSVTKFFGNTYRLRPIPKIIEEIQELIDKKIASNRSVIFNDDNIACDKKYVRQLFHELNKINITWSSQANLNIADDPEFLSLAAESGCISLYVGIETLNPANLKDIKKHMNKINKYEEAIKKIHDVGIVIIGSFIFGLNHDDECSIDETLEFVVKNDIDIPIFSILTPFPGTRIYEELEQQGRIIVKDWSKYNFEHVVYQPKRITPEKLQEKHDLAFKSMAIRSVKGRQKIAKRSMQCVNIS